MTDKVKYKREYYLANREYYRQWHLDHSNSKKEVTLARRVRETEKYLLTGAKKRARVNNMEFTITVDDIFIPTHCPYLGCALTREYGGERISSNPSLDRIDSSKGYTPDNIQVISTLANRLKNNATIEQLVAFSKGVLARHG